jgi:structural maintenance of chromosome 2
VTIIPLSKIKAKEIRPDAVAQAHKEVGPDNANLAISFVGFDKDVDAAMRYVFGGNFICTDMTAAKKVRLHACICERETHIEIER